jgi:hypothetical protein
MRVDVKYTGAEREVTTEREAMRKGYRKVPIPSPPRRSLTSLGASCSRYPQVWECLGRGEYEALSDNLPRRRRL